MTHLVQTMAYVGQTPWHGLGNKLSSGQPLEVWEREAGLNWIVKESEVKFTESVSDNHSSVFAYPNQKVLYRSDTNEPLSVVSQRFKVVQPREILEFYRDLTEVSGFELETAGVLKGGRKVWALARTGHSFTLQHRDETRGYVLLATACDGTMATTAQFTSVRVVCNNTLAIAVGDKAGAVKVPHSTSFNAQAVKEQLGISVSTWDTFMYKMKLLSKCKVNNAEAKHFIKQLIVDPRTPVTPAKEKSMAKLLSIYDGNGRGAELGSAKGSALGLVNAVTEFVDHEARARNADNRLDSAWFGNGAALKHKAFESSMALVA